MLDLSDVLQAEAVMVSLSYVGGNQVTAECIWIEDSCFWSLYVIEDKEPTHFLCRCGYLESLNERVGDVK